MLSVVDACNECDLVLKHHDAADGPTFFAIIIVGILVATAASLVELHYSPPLWLHAIIWGPLILISCILCLRIIKTLMITVEFRLKQLKGSSDGSL